MRHIAKLFKNGSSQAVRLPKEFRFDTKQVYIRRDEKTGNVILSRKPDNWDDFFAALKGLDLPEDFLSPKERDQTLRDRNIDPFEGWPAEDDK